MHCEKLATPNCNCEDCRPDLYKRNNMMTKTDALKKIEEANVPNLEALERKHKELGDEIAALKEASKKPSIDWSKLPVDTIVSVVARSEGNPVLRRFSHVLGSAFKCFYNGTCSRTLDNDSTGHMTWKHFKLAENPPVPWFGGGECPVPRGIKVKVWQRSGHTFTTTRAPKYMTWTHTTSLGTNDKGCDIIAYQILESEDWYTL